jgi:hypothetical protein
VDSMPAFSIADIEALLALCRHDLGTEPTGGVRIDHDGWEGVINAALDHGVIGPLQCAVSNMRSVPEGVVSSIQTAYLAQAARNFQLIHALSEVLPALRKCDIELCVMKGPAVALLAYEQITNRQFTDLDLLIRYEDLSQAEVALAQLGFRRAGPTAGRFQGEKDIQFIRDSDNVLLELHWALNAPARRFPLEMTGIWNRRQTVCFQDQAIPTLGLEDTLISLCIHASVHGWSSLKWIFDIARLLRYKAALIDWQSLLDRCRTIGCERIVAVNLRLAFVLFGIKPPDAVATEILSDESTDQLVERFQRAILSNEPLSRADLALCYVQLHDRVWDRFLIGYRHLPAPGQKITVGPRRYISRPLRLFHLYGCDWLRIALIGR